ncbi:tetratricopeptide repeat protein [Microbacter margulisiae]|uniref:Tetratricopeptide (TPR) repeat protein n=1 Tax=Microbacter margulisiae TaxID=1350067 RepID=A0A7W5DNX3_9PORP|nr:tetratricopeptide repeat protein [Microbacter margulisiae]MBB3186038.1 tetratricopeptide (TPR) repeat protein [Microbacter margulisiae]
MKNLLVGLLLLFSLYSCHRNSKINQERLQQIELITRTSPDRAMSLLHSLFPHPEQLNKSTAAYYAVCYNDAAWHVDPRLLSDSLATLAVTYYSKHINPEETPKAYFLLSLTKKEQQEADASADALLQAESFASLYHNTRILGLVFAQKGLLMHDQNEDSCSVKNHKIAASLFASIHDSSNQIIENLSIGIEFIDQAQYDSAWYYVGIAEKMARLSNDTVLLSSIFREKGMDKFYQGDANAAEMWLQAALHTSHDVYDAGKYMNLGWIYLKQKKYDLARTTLTTALRHNPPITLENACYQQLINTAYAQHDWKGLRRYALQFEISVDSAYDSSLKSSLLGLEKKYQYEHFRAQNQALTIKNQRLGLIALGILLLLMIIGYYYLRVVLKNREIQLLHEQEKVQIAEREKKLRQSIAGQLDVYGKIISLSTMSNDNPEHVGAQFQYLFNGGILKSEESIADFIKNVDEVYDHFSIKLQEQYPKLTKTDILICCLMRAGFENDTIARFLDIQMYSFHTRCHRLRERMSLPRKVVLSQFLANFSGEKQA